MKKILKNIILLILLSFSFTTFSASENDYTRYRDVDKGTFKEYGFKISKEFFKLKKYFEIYGKLSQESISELEFLVRKSLNYLPEDIENEVYYNDLMTSLEKGKNNIDSELTYGEIVKNLIRYLKNAKISKITGKITAVPSKGNAPLIVTLMADVTDPEGTLIPEYNYVWWIDLGGKKKILGNGPSLTYTFKEEGKYSVFCDVRSNHKNKKGYTDVLSFRGKADINVLSKIASVIIKVNGENLGNKRELKFTPEEARYGLIFDATSTVPTGNTKIIKTSWDFGNGVKREYDRGPKVERVSYFKEGEYEVVLKMYTNIGDVIEKKFSIFINYPIATINVKPLEGYLGDKFTFSAKTIADDENLTYNWEIIDIVDDKAIFRKQGKTFTYSFPKKGFFNVKLKVNSTYKNTEDIENKLIYISSRAPIVNFSAKKLFPNKPNLIFFDATETLDPDYTDNGKLKFSWLIDGERVKLKDSNKDESTGYYEFNSIGTHSVTLEVTDPDNIKGIKTIKVNIDSLLSVDFSANPVATKIGNNIIFKADSKNAVIYEWNFGDGTILGGKKPIVKHKYKKSGRFDVTLKVEDSNGKTNSYKKGVYISDGEKPIAILKISSGQDGIPVKKKNVCNGEDAYILNRVDTVVFDAGDSIDVNGEPYGLEYSLKIGNDKYFNGRQVSYKFDELGCFPVKLTVTSKKTLTTDTKNFWVKVENIKPTLSSLLVNVSDSNTDPVVVEVKAVGAKDRDGVITSYLWYYYTDINSEPQDFRITTYPNTKFVLPKITGNYYFVVVLTDDSGARVSSEDIGKRSSIILAGDNINVPLVDLSVNDSSIYLGESVVFTAKVKNILGINISKKCKYYWDFDGDGFYDQESTTPVVTYSYSKSGTFYAKLKVKHKGFSNTRFVEINVANRLTPDFKYISIGNTFLFISTSKGVYDSIIWDLGDGTKIQGKDSFVHVYKDSNLSHIVKLKLIEGTKIKTKEIVVRKNLKNLLKSKKSNFIVFSYPEDNNGKIVLKEKVNYVYIYPLLKNFKDELYVVDTDIDFDSDLNGGKDDDEDIISKTQKIIKVKLNNNREQKIAVYVKNKEGIVIDSKILSIEKEYIDITKNDISKVKFINLTDAQKKKITYLKEQISLMPKEYKNKSLIYLQRLQEEWNDDTEKTKVILEFEGFLDETNLKNKDELINILEGLLVENQEDKSEKNVAYTALKNLVPDDLVCASSGSGTEVTGLSCRDKIIEKLDAIKASNDIELNRVLAKEILASIVKSEKLSTDDKFKFKAILSTLVYGGVKNIPEEEKKKVEKETQEKMEEEINSFGLLSILKKVGYVILFIFGGFLSITLVFFIIYKVSNKDENLSFSDFILKKTSGKSKQEETKDDLISDLDELNINEEKENKDILSDIDISKNTSSTTTTPDWLKGVESSMENKKEVKKDENKVSNNDFNSEKTEVPSWLRGEEEKEEDNIKKDSKEEESKKEEDSVETGEIPDWLKGSLEEDVKEDKKDKEIKEDKKEDNKEKEENKKESLEEETSLEGEVGEIPDWLKGSLEENSNSKDNNRKNDEDKIPSWLRGEEEKEENNVKKDSKEEASKKEDNSVETGEIPDWLKGSLEEDVKEDKKDKEIKEEKQDKEIKEEKQEENKEKEENKKESLEEETSLEGGIGEIQNKETQEENKQQKKNRTKRTTSKKTVQKKTSKKSSKSLTEKKSKGKTKDNKKEVKKDIPDNDLWDDGMEIPDWLKSE